MRARDRSFAAGMRTRSACLRSFAATTSSRPSGEVFLRDLVEELADTDADFCRWWAEHEVLKRSDWREGDRASCCRGARTRCAFCWLGADAPGMRIMIVYARAASTDTGAAHRRADEEFANGGE